MDLKRHLSRLKSEQNSCYQCQDCHKSFIVTVGTIFHKVRKLPEWFMILGLMLNVKKSKSSHEISRDIGMHYKAMETKENTLFKGIIEMGETYIGGNPRGKGDHKRGRGTNKTPVVGMVERSEV